MEGISHEAASFAGHNKLSKLVVLYDSNDISLDGELNKAFSENTKARFEAYGWNYLLVKDGNDLEEIDKAITTAKSQEGPTIIEVKTTIGFGSPNKAGTNGVHGAPLGEVERKLTFENYGLDPEKRFNVSEEVYEIFQNTMLKRANEDESQWNSLLEKYAETYPELAEEFKLAISGKLPKIIRMNYHVLNWVIMVHLVLILVLLFKQSVKLSLHSLVDQQTLLVQTNPM